ncbi:hypothetical protein BDA96_06G016100 [Sorghum bicolor]|uniref:Uncharacterized protein n=1 Tax=Sorghum bicolor TaxID=4558 RepID=A0A921UBZ6_SORBI|nr:hypothetical protein BDA96_06G016100 [Sorghum bicolor]
MNPPEATGYNYDGTGGGVWACNPPSGALQYLQSRLERGLSSPEDLSHSLFPYIPCCDDDNFHEELVLTFNFSFLDCIKGSDRMI